MIVILVVVVVVVEFKGSIMLRRVVARLFLMFPTEATISVSVSKSILIEASTLFMFFAGLMRKKKSGKNGEC